jgi:hypothetical protein
MRRMQATQAHLALVESSGDGGQNQRAIVALEDVPWPTRACRRPGADSSRPLAGDLPGPARTGQRRIRRCQRTPSCRLSCAVCRPRRRTWRSWSRAGTAARTLSGHRQDVLGVDVALQAAVAAHHGEAGEARLHAQHLHLRGGGWLRGGVRPRGPAGSRRDQAADRSAGVRTGPPGCRRCPPRGSGRSPSPRTAARSAPEWRRRTRWCCAPCPRTRSPPPSPPWRWLASWRSPAARACWIPTRSGRSTITKTRSTGPSSSAAAAG